jgi:formylglycine-generating enzyme required for sulfatase activity
MLLLLPTLTEAQPPVRCSGPLSEAQLTDLLKAVPTLRMRQLVASCGIAFEPTGEVIGRLRSAGMPQTVLDAVRAATGPAERKRQAEQALWESMKESQEPTAFEDYLRRYPEGQFAEPARQKYRDLKVDGMRAEMERALAAGQWDAADGKIRDLLSVVTENDEIGGWRRQIAEGREATARAPGTKKVNLKDGLTYVWIPPGTFTMGCSPGDAECDDGEKPAHQVTITSGFWLGQTPVTQQAYQRVRVYNLPSYFKGANLPVENVVWNEAKAYCAAIGGRLPTEAEWEYAARAGSTGSRHGNLDEIAWYWGNSEGKTHEVGQKQANAFGLFDILGDVWQWTADWYGPYPPGAQSDPFGAVSGQFRALRGGSWSNNPENVRVSLRLKGVPGSSNGGIGLRCVGESQAADGRSADAERMVSAPRKLSAQDLDEILKRADAAYARQDYATAAPLYQKLADSGNSGAMNRLGFMYYLGRGVAQDYTQAVAWYRNAAEKANPAGMTNLGRMYQSGRGVSQDDTQAAAWYRKAAETGEPAGMDNLGFMYQNGRGVARDDTQALAWYRKAAEKADPAGMTHLGLMYQNGRGVAKDDTQAVAWYRKAADKGELAGMTNLGFMYQNGRGVAQDYSQAVAWYRKAAEKGEPHGMTFLGAMYETGHGVGQDDAQAVAWYRKAAENGSSEGMTNLGLAYQNGRGVAKDDTQAVAWYRKAVDKGEPAGMTNLGFMYQNGRGVAQDQSQAVAWYRKAADKGEPQGMTNLGVMYENGRGVAKDMAEALAWYSKAAALGNEAAKLNVKRLGQAENEGAGTAATPPATTVAGPTKVNSKDGLTYVWIPPGTFQMGCSPGDAECSDYEKPAHQVTITKGFWMGQTPVTQQAYQRVTGENPSSFKGANLPVEHVTWNEAKTYCIAIGGRLPTEAEWEYAARAGSTGARYGNLDEIAWYQGNSGGKTHEVGQKLANAFGLYDVLGNVLQWVADWDANYRSGAQNDPPGAENGEHRVLRGGASGSSSSVARVSGRLWDVPGRRFFRVGLRCVGK